MQKKIFEANIDTETILESTVHASTVINLPFVSPEQKRNFEKKLGELLKDAVEVIKDGIDASKKGNDQCNCDICPLAREQKLKGGNPFEKSRFRF